MSSVTFKTTNVQDNFLDNAVPNQNQNGDTHLYIGELNVGSEVTRTIIKFPLDDGTIPAGATISSATIRLYLMTDYSDNARTLSVYRLKRAWSESTSSWNEYSTGNSWATAGADAVTDREATDIGTRSMSGSESTSTFIEISLTASAVQEMITGGVFANNGFLLKVDTESNDGYEFQSNASATTANHPELVVVYSVASASASASRSASKSLSPSASQSPSSSASKSASASASASASRSTSPSASLSPSASASASASSSLSQSSSVSPSPSSSVSPSVSASPSPATYVAKYSIYGSSNTD